MSFNIVLVEPQIPPNTGNIGRLCIATKSKLHLVEPLAFDIDEKAVRRAGLDYWKHIELTVHPSYQTFKEFLGDKRAWYFTKFATKSLYEASFEPGDFLVFGKETTGLPKEVHDTMDPAKMLKVPMPGQDIVRSLNLAGTAHIALYEALRQTGFKF